MNYVPEIGLKYEQYITRTDKEAITESTFCQRCYIKTTEN